MMHLNWYRSYPGHTQSPRVTDNRPHVVDPMPRLYMHDYDYNTISNWPSDYPGFCMLEWDMALDHPSREMFAHEALLSPYQVLVARYYIEGGYSPRTDTFGFGCIYFPTKVLGEFQATNPAPFTDAYFSRWYRSKYGTPRVTYKVHPQHLHQYR